MTTNDFLILFLVFSNILLIIYCCVIFFQVYIRDMNTKEDNTDNPTQVKKTASGTQHLMEDRKDLAEADYLADFMLQSTEEQWEDYKAKFFISKAVPKQIGVHDQHRDLNHTPQCSPRYEGGNDVDGLHREYPYQSPQNSSGAYQ